MNRSTRGSSHADPGRTSPTAGPGAAQPRGKPLFSRDDLDRFYVILLLLWPLLRWAMAAVCVVALFVGPTGSFVLAFGALCAVECFLVLYKPKRLP